MSKRREYQLNQSEIDMIIEMSKPRLLTMDDTRNPQDLANEIWELIAHARDLQLESIQPVANDHTRFTAEPVWTMEWGMRMLPREYAGLVGKTNTGINLRRRLKDPIWAHAHKEIEQAISLMDAIPVGEP